MFTSINNSIFIFIVKIKISLEPESNQRPDDIFRYYKPTTVIRSTN